MVSYDTVAVLSRFSKRYKIRFTLLSDTKSKIIRAFGLLNEKHPPGDPVHGVAHPAILIVDGNGKVTGRFAEADYTRRPDINDVLDAIKR